MSLNRPDADGGAVFKETNKVHVLYESTWTAVSPFLQVPRLTVNRASWAKWESARDAIASSLPLGLFSRGERYQAT